jgi:N-acetylglucosaminyldiphosphoundecaprenol N-acetyl-beta-D-mannosaminyltransferase
VKSIEVLRCRVDGLGRDEAVARVIELARGTRPSLVVTLGTEMVMEAQHNDAFRREVNGAALSLCDTIGLLCVSRLRGGPLRTRVTGVDLVDALAYESPRAGVSLYFLGGAPGIAARAADAMVARYPGARIAGCHDGYFSDAQAPALLAGIRSSGAQILCAGMGSPKQELWLAEHLAASGATVGIGVGGTFDVLSGTVARAPRVWRALGLEWLYRLIREPRRWRRQLALPQFALLALGETIAVSAGSRGRAI